MLELIIIDIYPIQQLNFITWKGSSLNYMEKITFHFCYCRGTNVWVFFTYHVSCRDLLNVAATVRCRISLVIYLTATC